MRAHRAAFCATIMAWSGAVTPTQALIQCGAASWYDESAGTQSANGGRVDPSAFTAAHRSLPFGTRVRVENLSNGRAATLIINDRGPFVGARIIDVTRAAAVALAFVDSGVARVRISTLGAEAEGVATNKCP
jgi:rare lipoprotein A